MGKAGKWVYLSWVWVRLGEELSGYGGGFLKQVWVLGSSSPLQTRPVAVPNHDTAKFTMVMCSHKFDGSLHRVGIEVLFHKKMLKDFLWIQINWVRIVF